ncbi:HNH endonuclease domain-containing protein [Flammeovirga sp. SubArs3]|uniref:HNH endonuclease domain-containing protein n=1 Tax=Flammeovirga sp. SubArs3 TaxID=2995316 RepID=UPI00248B52DC|nr:HNH endonuclease domain-containing protein [Flammeovirga sp. SubArs3]
MNRLNSNSNEAFRLISHILQKDSKNSTYKLALLRGTIEILSESNALVYTDNQFCYLPLAPLCEKWIYYYTPFVYHGISQNSGNKIAFYQPLKNLIDCYSGTLNDIQKGLAKDIRFGFKNGERRNKYILCIKEIAICIIRNPMKHIAHSFYKDTYQLYLKRANPNFSTLLKSEQQLFKNDLHNTMGYIQFKKFIQPGLELFGSFLIGEQSLIQNWATTTMNFSNNKHLSFNVEQVSQLLLQSTTIRSVEPPKGFYQELQSSSQLYCVWSGKRLTNKFDTDHIIPYSYWKNNDIWNLLPSSKSINNKKSDKIPTTERLIKQKELILSTWKLTHTRYEQQFEREVALSLNIINGSFEDIFNALCQKSDYLINELGFEGW